MHNSTLPAVSSDEDAAWEQWEEKVVARTDEIANRDGIPHEVAYHFAQQQLAQEVRS